MKLSLIGMVFLSSTLVGCGGNSGGKSGSGWKKHTSGGTPIELRKQVHSCITVFSTNDSVEFSVTQFLNELSQVVKVNFTGQVRKNYVMSNRLGPIAKMNYNTVVNYIREIDYDEYSEEYTSVKDRGLKFKKAGEKLDVCPSIKRYDPDTYETAGLNISHSITKTHDAIKLVMPELHLERLNVYVAPILNDIKKIRTQNSGKHIDSSVMTDNAFYYNKLKMIAFLPESREHKSVAPFWEIPMVGSHEYGHHVFHTIVGKNVKGGLKHSLGCFKNHNGIGVQKFVGKSYSSRDTSPKGFTLGAINEGFADLISFYSMGEQESSLAGVKCMEKTRDVGSSAYADGTEKTFSFTAQWRLDSSLTYSSPENCDEPDFQEIHDVGALFAHVADKLISKVITDKELKLKIILNYAKSHAKNLDKFKGLKPSIYLFNVLQLVYKEALLENGTVVELSNKDKYCDEIKKNFEYFESESCDSL